MPVVSLKSPGAAGRYGHCPTGLPGDRDIGLIGVLGADELMGTMGVCNIKKENVVG